MSPLRKGIAFAVYSMAGGATAVSMVLAGARASFTLPNEALSDIAQIGATLFVAYAVETSWLLKESKVRGSARENWVGYVVGIGICSAVGIAIAIALVGHHSPSFLVALGMTWMLFSLGFLAFVVALLPYVLYEWTHALHTERPDE